MQDTEEETVEDIDLGSALASALHAGPSNTDNVVNLAALRSIMYCPNDPRVALQVDTSIPNSIVLTVLTHQGLKMVGIIAFRHPEARAFLTNQAR